MPRIGLFEHAAYTAKGIQVSGWACDTDRLNAPVEFYFYHGDFIARISPNQERDDIASEFGVHRRCGFSREIEITFDDAMAEREALVAARWPDGSFTPLGRLPTGKFETDYLRFSTFEEFGERFQNPAFRMKNDSLLVWAAKRALKISEPKSEFYMAAFCVLAYRHLLEGLVPEQEIAAALSNWKADTNNEPLPKGTRLRWVGSVHLAAGYVFLSWGEMDKARQEFEAICKLLPELGTWPQAATNMAIAFFMAGWLNWQSGNLNKAIKLLEKSTSVLETAARAKFWNWHQFEEFRGLLKALQECFALLTILKGDGQDHILPHNHILRFSHVSRVLGQLAERGDISNSLLPSRDWKPIQQEQDPLSDLILKLKA